MKSRAAQITITSTVRTDGRREEPSVFKARGNIREVNGRTHIAYEETDEDGQVVRTHLIPEQERLEIRRTGSVETVLLCEAGQLTEAVYKTAYGEIPLQLHTTKYSAVLEEGTALIEVAYEILQSSEIISQNEIVIRIS